MSEAENELLQNFDEILRKSLEKLATNKGIAAPGKLNRLEIIDPNGRQVVYYGDFELSYQDEGRTLKIFTKKPIPESKQWT